jgi:hypothetical protein
MIPGPAAVPSGCSAPAQPATAGACSMLISTAGIRRVSGGIWRLDGITWTPLTDALNTQWIGSLDTSPTNPDLILVGTGEPHIRAGTGLWRSTDGASLAAAVARESSHLFRASFPTARPLWAPSTASTAPPRGSHLEPHRTAALAHRPGDPSRESLGMCATTPVRSNNGGITWTQVQGAGLPTSGNGGDHFGGRSQPSLRGLRRAGCSRPMPQLDRRFAARRHFWGQGWYNNAIGVRSGPCAGRRRRPSAQQRWNSMSTPMCMPSSGRTAPTSTWPPTAATAIPRTGPHPRRACHHAVRQYRRGQRFPLSWAEVRDNAVADYRRRSGSCAGAVASLSTTTTTTACGAGCGVAVALRCGRSLTGDRRPAPIDATMAQPPRCTPTMAPRCTRRPTWAISGLPPMPRRSRPACANSPWASMTVPRPRSTASTGRRLRVFDAQPGPNAMPAVPGVRCARWHLIHRRRCFALMNGMGTPGSKVYRSDDNGHWPQPARCAPGRPGPPDGSMWVHSAPMQ